MNPTPANLIDATAETAQLAQEIRSLRAQCETLTADFNRQLMAACDDHARELAALEARWAQQHANAQAEISQLRAEVAHLRQLAGIDQLPVLDVELVEECLLCRCPLCAANLATA